MSEIRSDGKIPHVRMFAVATKPFPEATVAIRETFDEAEDEAVRMNDALGRQHRFSVFPVLVHYERKVK